MCFSRDWHFPYRFWHLIHKTTDTTASHSVQLVFLVIISQHRSPTVWLFSFSISFSTVVEHSNDLILDNSTISITSCQDILIFLCFQVCRFYQITAHQYWYTVPAHAASFGAKLITLFLIFCFVFFVFSFNHFTWSYLPLEWWQKQTPEELLSITPELNIVPPSIEHLETHSTGLNGVLRIFGAVFLVCWCILKWNKVQINFSLSLSGWRAMSFSLVFLRCIHSS